MARPRLQSPRAFGQHSDTLLELVLTTLPHLRLCVYWPGPVPSMVQVNNGGNKNDALIKFLAPHELKRALEELAAECDISLSAPLRLVVSEYPRLANEQT